MNENDPIYHKLVDFVDNLNIHFRSYQQVIVFIRIQVKIHLEREMTDLFPVIFIHF